LQTTLCCDKNGVTNGSIGIGNTSNNPDNNKCTGFVSQQFQFLNHLGLVPTKSSAVLCCSQDPSVAANPASFCGTYWGPSGTCNNIMTNYCKTTTAGQSDKVCSCINSTIPLAYCFDSNCTNNPNAYVTADNDTSKCPASCVAIMNVYSSGSSQVQNSIKNSNICQYCKDQATGICPGSLNIYWIIGGIIIILLIAAICYWIWHANSNKQKKDDE
jgi:hypothetical protein